MFRFRSIPFLLLIVLGRTASWATSFAPPSFGSIVKHSSVIGEFVVEKFEWRRSDDHKSFETHVTLIPQDLLKGELGAPRLELRPAGEFLVWFVTGERVILLVDNDGASPPAQSRRKYTIVRDPQTGSEYVRDEWGNAITGLLSVGKTIECVTAGVRFLKPGSLSWESTPDQPMSKDAFKAAIRAFLASQKPD
ncbi:MAG TPA: hypothetical protein VJS92_04470 [Candidatus Polarisedimenticolaceae bacterium]|nr:hypothetical protein [Candidatus Polarisedimenticolaceae bacterium]